jgi:plastocyanin
MSNTNYVITHEAQCLHMQNIVFQHCLPDRHKSCREGRTMKTTMIALVAVMAAAGCSSSSSLNSGDRHLPTFTRTGAIHDIRIGELITPTDLEVKPGDEVRWINTLNASGRIVFIEKLRDRVSCQKNFSGIDSTKLDANDTVSLCFSSPGTYKYIARMDSPLPGGEKNLSGLVRVYDRAGTTQTQ